MKGNPAVPGGPLTITPTRWNTSRCSTASAFFFAIASPPHPTLAPAAGERVG
jgi:hypothetical protein